MRQVSACSIASPPGGTEALDQASEKMPRGYLPQDLDLRHRKTDRAEGLIILLARFSSGPLAPATLVKRVLATFRTFRERDRGRRRARTEFAHAPRPLSDQGEGFLLIFFPGVLSPTSSFAQQRWPRVTA